MDDQPRGHYPAGRAQHVECRCGVGLHVVQDVRVEGQDLTRPRVDHVELPRPAPLGHVLRPPQSPKPRDRAPRDESADVGIASGPQHADRTPHGMPEQAVGGGYRSPLPTQQGAQHEVQILHHPGVGIVREALGLVERLAVLPDPGAGEVERNGGESRARQSLGGGREEPPVLETLEAVADHDGGAGARRCPDVAAERAAVGAGEAEAGARGSGQRLEY